MKAYGVLVNQRLNQRRKAHESLRKQELARVFTVLQRLAGQVPFEAAYVFGSVTQPYRFSQQSDIDIGFMKLPDEYFFFTMAFLSRELGREVDVIQLERERKLRTKILQEGIRWIAQNSVC